MPDKPPTAVSGEEDSPYEEEFRVIGQILERDAEPIMERWFERATEETVHAAPERREEAMDELLEMLQSLGQRLKEQTSHALEQAHELARRHGQQRSGVEWELVDLVRDYEILHSVALEHLGQALSERLTYRQAMILGAVTERAIGSAVEAFHQIAQQRLEKQVQQQAELRQLTLDLTEAEHHERQRIAAKLHDDLQQMLVATKMRLNTALNSDSTNHAPVKEATDLIDQAVEVTRNLTADLHPRVLENQRLTEAIDWLGEMFQQRYGLTVTVERQVSAEGEPGSMALRRLVYDAVRELLFNIVKHANTDQAWVTVRCGDRSPWRIEVRDRGLGASNMEKADSSPGEVTLGLGSLRHRIEQIDGSIEIDSKPGEGTRVMLTVPLEPASAGGGRGNHSRAMRHARSRNEAGRA